MQSPEAAVPLDPYSSRYVEPVSPWAVSGVIFAATMMIVIGIWQAISGLTAIFGHVSYTVPANYSYNWSLNTWGWIYLLLGIVVTLAGFALFSGKTWAYMFAIFIAAFSAFTNFFYIPYYPFWSILVIALDVFIIWSLAKVASAVES
jgi:hypothetical protein